MSGKRTALLAQKEKILEEIKYYEMRIKETRANTKTASFYEDDNSSDSETELALVDNDPSLSELKQQETMLKTCLRATQELTGLEVLQSEVNVLVDSPAVDGSSPMKEEGVWREVMAECRLDLVPFAITFYAFKASRNFAPIEYKNLKVTAIKKAHGVELAKSVLPGLTRPSDALEVVRSYALAHRSRRTTLARLANQFSNSLVLEPIPEGGYLMKCANLLEVSWTLQNKWSPIAPFHHRMKFDLEYMDEAYIKIITQAHRQLSEPDLDTDERTLLLAKIISTCLEAQGPTQELHDSMSSDPETANTLHKRRTTLDREPEVPSVKRAKKDSEVMAPPKAPPKKVKKGKENVDSNKKTTKRPIESNENADNPKKQKSIENTKETDVNNEEKASNNEHSVATSKNNEPSENTSGISKSDSIKNKSAKNSVNEKETARKDNEIETARKDNEQNAANVQNSDKPKSAKKTKTTVQNIAKTVNKAPKNIDKIVKPIETAKPSNEVTSKANEKPDKIVKQDKKVESNKGSEINLQKAKTTDKITKKPQNGEKILKGKDAAKVVKKFAPKDDEKNPKNDKTAKHNVNSNKNAAGDDNATKNNVISNTNKLNNEGSTVTEASKNTNVASDKIKTSKNDVAGNKVGKMTKKIVSTEKSLKKPVTDKILNKEIANNVQKVKNIASASNINAKVSGKVNKVTKSIPGKSSVASANKNGNVATAEKNPKTNPTQTKVPKLMSNINTGKAKNSVPKIAILTNKPKATIPSKKIITSNTTNLSDGNSGKENSQNSSKVSKIPLKKFSSENTSKLPLRVSPRQPLKSKLLSKFGPETKLKPK